MTDTNLEKVDLLDQDNPISGQKFSCISFVSPEKILEDKNIYFFKEFLKEWDMAKSLEKFNQFLNFIAYKHNIENNVIVNDFNDFIKEETDVIKSKSIDINSDFTTYLENNEERLEEDFQRSNDFKTSVRGLKIRGNFPTQEEAELHCKKLRELDPNHDIFVGPVGMWIPWEPNAYKTGKIEYLENELNNLMHKKKENEEHAKELFDQRIRETKRAAIEENIKKAKETGNSLTQTITKNDDLVNVANVSLEEALTAANLRDELFDQVNVETKTSEDAGVNHSSGSV